MIEFELDIPLLTEDGIQMEYSFSRVKELDSSSMIDELILIEMLILLIDSFDKGVSIYKRRMLFGQVLKVVNCTCFGLGLFRVKLIRLLRLFG